MLGRGPESQSPFRNVAHEAMSKVQNDCSVALTLLPHLLCATLRPKPLALPITPLLFLKGPLYQGPQGHYLPAPLWQTVMTVVRV